MDAPVTMQDIANAAHVGKATVSLALRNDPRLREETRKRIQRIAAEMGYRPNAVVANLMAQLRAGRIPKFQATLGLVNASQEKGKLQEVITFTEWAKGCRHRAKQIGYGFDEFWLYEPGLTPARLLKILESRNIRGLVVAAVLRHGRLPEEFSELWERLACVVVGVQTTRPRLHFACNDQYSTARQAVREVLSRGYTRPALVIDPDLDELLDYRFSAGFLSATNQLPKNRKIPSFNFSSVNQKNFSSWFHKHSPDVILTMDERVRDWLLALKVLIPDKVGLVHLDLHSNLPDWAGMNQNNDLVGAAALDMLVDQLHRNEFGSPVLTKCMMVASTWVDGPSVRTNYPKNCN